MSVNSIDTLNYILEKTKIASCPEYVSLDSADKISPRERHFLDWGRKKIKAEAVLFQRIPVNNSCFPLVYFRRLQDANPAAIAEAHRLAWNMGRAPLLFLILPGRVLVHSTFEAPKLSHQDSGSALDPQAGLVDVLDITSNAEQTRQNLAKYQRDELLSGRYWEQEANRKHFGLGTRIERSLLENLSAIRSLLLGQGLDLSLIHI